MGAVFGVAGNSQSFYDEGFKASEDMPAWLWSKGLDAYEYQCGNGVRVGAETAQRIGENAKSAGIIMSVHTPYYINPATPDDEKREKGIGYIMQSLECAANMGAERIVIHSGAVGKLTREEAVGYAEKMLTAAKERADGAGFGNIHFCIETMGKINQLGDLDEVMRLCGTDDSFLPVIDFGHLNARTHGSLKTTADFEHIFDTIENKLGSDRLKIFHSHFSHIEYTKGGEKKHLTFEDKEYGPFFEPVAEITARKNLSPVFICESAGTQTEDAIEMKRIYKQYTV
ncbi:MAG: TIM barrel protein [Oscillospiraceae bacterium]|nr:TIM barrel protein [Oscillospiraceae bacterium]